MKKNLVLPALAAIAAVTFVFSGCKEKLPTPIKATAISLATTATTIEIDQEVTIVPTFTPADADNRSPRWSTSDAKVATVSIRGVVKGIGAGTATITAIANDGSGVTGTISITVNPAPAAQAVEVTFAEGLSLDEVNPFNYSEIVDAEGAPVEDLSVVVSTPGSIGKITLKLTTDVEAINTALTGMGIADGFELGELPAALAQQLAGFFGTGLPTGENVVGKKSVKIDFSAIQPLIAGVPGGVNQFDIEIKALDQDNAILPATQTLKLKFIDDSASE